MRRFIKNSFLFLTLFLSNLLFQGCAPTDPVVDIPPVTDIGVGGTVSYTANDGVAELTSAPTVSPATVSAGNTVTINVPVDSDTGYVFASLTSPTNGTASVSGCSSFISAGTAQTAPLTCTVSSINANGTYSVEVTVASSYSNYWVGNFTFYTELSGSSTYQKYIFTAGNQGSGTDTGVSLTSVTITGGTSSSGTGTAEGSYSIPVGIPFTSLPYTGGTVSSTVDSFYEITGLTVGNNYTFTLSSMTADVDLAIYSTNSGGTWTGYYCGSTNWGTTNDSCSFTATSTSAFIIAYEYTTAGGTFTIEGLDNGAPLPSSGSLAVPTTIALSTLPDTTGTVSSTQDSFYAITGLTIGNVYTISLSAMTNNVDLDVYSTNNAGSWTGLMCGSSNSGTTDDSCSFIATSTTVYLWINEWTTAGATFTINAVDNGLPPTSEGLTTVPINIAFTALPYTTGTVAMNSNSYYAVSGLTIGNVYTITLSGITGDATLDIYSTNNAGTWSGWYCGSNNFGATNESCSFVANSTTAFIIAGDNWTAMGSTFTIEGIDHGVAPPAEGTMAAPLNIAFTALPHTTGSVAPTASSYYAITGLTIGNSYTFSLTALTDNVDLYIYSANNTTTWDGLHCSSTLSGTADDSCTFTAVTNTVYLNAKEWTSTGATFAIAGTDNGIPVAGTYGDGTYANPVAIPFTSLPAAGTVGSNQNSYYEITGLTIGNVYTISFSALTADVDLAIYSTNSTGSWNGYYCGSGNSGTVNESCSFVASATSAFVKATELTLSGATFTIEGLDNGLPPSSEGTLAVPLSIALAAMPHNGSASPTAGSYYEITGLTVGHSYTVDLSALTANVGLNIYANSNFWANFYCSSLNSGTTNESCSFVASTSIVYVYVSESTTVGATYTIGVTDNGVAMLGTYGEGFSFNPVVIAFNTLPYSSGTVSSTQSSYYTITGLTVGNNYTFSLSAMTDNVDLSIYSTNTTGTWSGILCASSNTGVVDDSCNFTATTTTVYIKVTEMTLSGSTYTVGGIDNGLPVTVSLPASYTFEASSILPPEFYSNWLVDTTYGGANASFNSISSGTITHSQATCTMLYVNNASAGSVQFWYNTSSETFYDYLVFYINGTMQIRWSGLNAWTQSAVYTLPVGQNELKWCYEKDGSVNSNLDKVWVDDITIN